MGGSCSGGRTRQPYLFIAPPVVRQAGGTGPGGTSAWGKGGQAGWLFQAGNQPAFIFIGQVA